MTLWTDDSGKLRLGWRIVLGILLVLVANALAGAIANAAANSQRSFEALYRPTLMILLLACFSAMLLFADRIEGNPLEALGLGKKGAASGAIFGVLVGLFCVGAAVAAIAAFSKLSFNVRMNRHTLVLLAVELFILATGAMAEELMFRGYPFQRILEGSGPAIAIAVLSVLFGVAHYRNPHAGDVAFVSLFNTIFVGILLAIAYLRARNLWLPWGVHFGWNAALGVLFGLPVSGLNEFSVMVQGKATGPVWLTGGPYGIEGGVAGTLAILVGFVPVLWFTRQRPSGTGQSPTNRVPA